METEQGASGSCGDQSQSQVGVQALECLHILESNHQTLSKVELPNTVNAPSWRDASMEAQGEARGNLLAEKRSVGGSMEELRATMRSVQEQCERCTVETRNSTAMYASSRTMLVSTHDELAKVHAQLRRATQQASDHLEARRRLGHALTDCAESFQNIIGQEVEAHAAIQNEVLQLQQVVRDLESRLRNSSGEMDRLVRANAKASAEVTALMVSWRQEHDECLAGLEEDSPLDACTEFLGRLARAERAEPAPAPSGAEAS
mmetsp:Transcript_131461/g.408678  ORF Transcript_131461/g.408678 Transcript_131461/m.408678 type:complete len:260 (-) Transcript_131461:45-824(-)